MYILRVSLSITVFLIIAMAIVELNLSIVCRQLIFEQAVISVSKNLFGIDASSDTQICKAKTTEKANLLKVKTPSWTLTMKKPQL